MFGKQGEGNISLRAIKNFPGSSPFCVIFLSVHLILVSPPDSLHRSGGVCSRPGAQSGWVVDLSLGTVHRFCACILTLRYIHKESWGDIPVFRVLWITVGIMIGCSQNITLKVLQTMIGFAHVVPHTQFNCHLFCFIITVRMYRHKDWVRSPTNMVLSRWSHEGDNLSTVINVLEVITSTLILDPFERIGSWTQKGKEVK